MRKIDQLVTQAVQELKNISQQNTAVVYSVSTDQTIVTLHGSLILEHHYPTNKTTVNFHNYATNVTVARINAALKGLNKPEYFRIQKGQIILEPKGAVFNANEEITLI